jgi:asparagine synthase (glutamine-hydrolysing)
LSAGYKGTLDNTETKLRATGETTKENGVFDQTVDAGINLSWTIFDGFNITANYQKLKELERQGETNTRIAIEDLIANIAAERFPIHTPQNKEEYYYRTIFEEHFPSESAARSVPSVPSVACSTAEALAWDASFQGKNDPSGRAVAGVHEEAYKD